MTITTRLFTYFHGRPVGKDAAGNCYYKEKRARGGRREKRWVLYNGAPEPSNVPPEWHGWLHYTTDIPPDKQHRTHHGWEKPALSNQTGTPGAYLPPGHLSKGGAHAPTTASYQPWKP